MILAIWTEHTYFKFKFRLKYRLYRAIIFIRFAWRKT